MDYPEKVFVTLFLIVYLTYHKITANSFGSFIIIEYLCSN